MGEVRCVHKNEYIQRTHIGDEERFEGVRLPAPAAGGRLRARLGISGSRGFERQRIMIIGRTR